MQQQANGETYQPVISRGTSEARGAVWFQKCGATGVPVDMGAPTYVGVGSTAFSANTSYEGTFTSTGTSTVTLKLRIRRLSDDNYFTSSGTWSATPQDCLSQTDSSSPLPQKGATAINIYQSVSDIFVYAWEVANYNPGIVESVVSPVLAKGGTYDGWAASAIAAPAICDDDTRWVMTVSLWSNVVGKWASAFFTCAYADKMTVWNYVSGSLLAPTGSDYIFANAGIAWFGGQYVIAVGHYPNSDPNTKVGIYTSPNLTSWTTVDAALLNGYFDPTLTVNPNNGKLELLAATGGVSRTVLMKDSSDSITWSAGSTVFASQGWMSDTGSFGAPTIFWTTGTNIAIPAGSRVMMFDCGGISGRSLGCVYDPAAGFNFTLYGLISSAVPGVPWESVQTADCCGIEADFGDGAGLLPRILYFGGDNASGIDDTNSSIGMGTLGPVS